MDVEAVLIIGTLGMLMLAFAIVFFILMFQRKLTNRKLELQAIQERLTDQEANMTYALLDAQEKERKRVAADLHDNLGNMLVTLKIFTDNLKSKLQNEEAHHLVAKISETAVLAGEEVRKISHSLDSGLLKHFGLKAAIRQLFEAVEMSKSITITRELQIEDNFDYESGLQIYRITQELVTNALKYSRCSIINYELTQIADEVNLIFEDNGRGFDTDQAKKGLGLKSVQNRVDMLSGALHIDSQVGRGSSFVIEIPYHG